MQPLDTELNVISFSDWGITSHLFSKHFTLFLDNLRWGQKFTKGCWFESKMIKKMKKSNLLTISSVFVCDGKTILLISFFCFSASMRAVQPSGRSGAFAGTHSLKKKIKKIWTFSFSFVLEDRGRGSILILKVCYATKNYPNCASYKNNRSGIRVLYSL